MWISKRSNWLLGALLSAGVTAALPLAAPAQLTPPPQQSPLAQARKQVTDARVEVNQTKVALDRARIKVEANFGKANPGYATAQKTYTKAMIEVKTMTAAALAGLKSKPEYLDALKAKQAAKDKQAALQADSKSTEDDLQAAFTAVVTDAKVVSDMEEAATQNDPKIVDAKQRLTDAKQNLDDFKSKIDAFCATDPEYQQAYQAATGAEQRLAQAQASLQQQAAAQAAAAAAAAKAHASQPGQPGQAGQPSRY